MGFNEFLSSIFGNKSTRDMKEIQPSVDKLKAAYPEVAKLDNDGLTRQDRGTERIHPQLGQPTNAPRPKNSEPASKNVELEDREEVFRTDRQDRKGNTGILTKQLLKKYCR